MYHGYTESEDKIEERKRRILGTVAPTDAPSTENDEQKKQMTPTKGVLKRQILFLAVLYPIAFFMGDLLGRYIERLLR